MQTVTKAKTKQKQNQDQTCFHFFVGHKNYYDKTFSLGHIYLPLVGHLERHAVLLGRVEIVGVKQYFPGLTKDHKAIQNICWETCKKE